MADETKTECGDQNVATVVGKYLVRAQFGLLKYGVTTERTDLTLQQWLQHLQDELMDATVYTQRLMHDYEVAQFAVQNEREAIAIYIENTKDVWGKNLAENIRQNKHLVR